MPTTDNTNWKIALDGLVAELRMLYGSRLAHVVLYGSHARGEAHPASDIDVLVVLNPLGDFWEELSRIQPLASRYSIENDVVLSVLPVDAEEYARPPSRPLFINTRREGVVVA